MKGEGVLDINKVITSLLRSGRVRRILLHPELELYTPPYMLEEIKKDIEMNY